MTTRSHFYGDDLERLAGEALRAAFHPLSVVLDRVRGHWQVSVFAAGAPLQGLRIARKQTTIHDALREVSEFLRKIGRRRLVEQLSRASRRAIDLPDEWFERTSRIAVDLGSG